MAAREARTERGGLRLEVLTPEATVLDREVRGLRLPTDTGQVGLRPRGEPSVLPVEPGLVLLHTGEGLRYVATAGGIARSDGARVLLLTPVAVHGDAADDVLARLDEALARPGVEQELRRTIEGLELGMLRELRAPSGADAGEPGERP